MIAAATQGPLQPRRPTQQRGQGSQADVAVAFDLELSKYVKYLQGIAAKATVRHNGKVVAEKTADLGNAVALKLTSQPRALLFVTVEQAP